MALRTKRADGIDLTDPQEQVSLAHWFALSIALLLISTVWAIYREISGLRPWKGYQDQFKRAAVAHYTEKLRTAEEELAKLKQSEEYAAAQAALAEAETELEGRQDEIAALAAKRDEKQALLSAKREELKPIRLEYQYSVYNWEQVGDDAKPAWEARIKAVQDQVNSLLQETLDLDNEVNDIARQIFEISGDRNKALAKVAAFETDVARYNGLIEDVEKRPEAIVQYYVPELDHATDRCATCHVGALYPELGDIESTLEEMGEFKWDKEKYASLFKSHPGDHLQKHPPEKFGCTSCHAGDGLMLSSEWESHGTHHHHEEPLHRSPTEAPKAFGHVTEAGCNKCHQQEMEIPGAPLLSFGKQLFSETCAGCHKAKGIWPEEDALDAAQKKLDKIKSSLMQAKKTRKDLAAEQTRIDDLLDDETIGDDEYDRLDKALAKRKDRSRLALLDIEEKKTQTERKIADLAKDIRSIGPDLRNVREKLRPDWIKQWLMNPHDFYEKTKMPNFYLPEEHAEAIAAYLWQNSRKPRYGYDRDPPQSSQMIEKGARLFKESGCLACHVGAGPDGEVIDVRPSFGMGEDGKPIKKRGFGPELTRTGEKTRYEWMWRWIYDPHEMNPDTRMPNLRLQEEQAKAIAAYLSTQKKGDVEVTASQWENVPAYLEDPEYAKKGYELVQRNGCYSCHNIQDMAEPDKLMRERFGRIGAELSAHGSKTLHLFDFGLIEHDVQENMWGDAYHPNMTRFDYIAYKAWKPRDFERGRYYQSDDDESHLRMPSLNLSREEAHALATFVIGLVEKPVPHQYVYKPGYPKSAVVEGRNLTLKHNCVACHAMEDDRGGDITQLWEDKNFAPPTLQGEGRRIQPEWFFGFMKHPFHLRPWLSVRMPYFALSDGHARGLSEYFQGVDSQPYPAAHRKPVHLTPAEMREAKGLMENQCQRCHNLGEKYDPKGQAPLLNMSKERIKYDWIAPWVQNPQAIIPYTRMPSLGLTARQAKLLADYIQVMNTDYKPVRGKPEVEMHRAHPPAAITEN